ncbi:hypothetical protein FKM82_012160 [Ascaphus truei]
MLICFFYFKFKYSVSILHVFSLMCRVAFQCSLLKCVLLLCLTWDCDVPQCHAPPGLKSLLYLQLQSLIEHKKCMKSQRTAVLTVPPPPTRDGPTRVLNPLLTSD